MHLSKRYGEYKIERCPFCKKQATTTNAEGMPVCYEHKNENIPELKCACGSTLEMRTGKYGIFFSCIKCGIIRKNRVFEMNDDAFKQSYEKSKKKAASSDRKTKGSDEPRKEKPRPAPREIVVRADDPYYCS